MKKFLLIWILVFSINAQTYALNFESGYLGSAYMEGTFLDGDLLLVQVIVEDMQSPILGSSFSMIYEKEKLDFLRYEPGSFLERGGNPFYLVKDKDEKGKLVFGSTLRREDNFPLGSGKLVDFYFQIYDGESFAFEFENAVISTLDSVRQDLDTVKWEDLFIEKNENADPGYALNQLSLDSDITGINLEKYFSKPILFIGALFSLLLLLALFRAKNHGEKRPA
jgi:hypothetical protein